jgi:hypothetical protein
MAAHTRNGDVEKLLRACSPSRLDGVLRRICPRYKADTSKPSLLYEEIHNLAVLMILSRLRLAGIEAEAEIAIEYGVVDLVVKCKGEIVAIVEVKTGRVKLIQSAAYAYITGKPVFIVEMRTGRVTRLTPDVGGMLLDRVTSILRDIKEVRGDTIIPNPGCRYCVADCRYGNGKNMKGADPARNILSVLDSIDDVVGELVEGLRREIERAEKAEGRREEMSERVRNGNKN